MGLKREEDGGLVLFKEEGARARVWLCLLWRLRHELVNPSFQMKKGYIQGNLTRTIVRIWINSVRSSRMKSI